MTAGDLTEAQQQTIQALQQLTAQLAASRPYGLAALSSSPAADLTMLATSLSPADPSGRQISSAARTVEIQAAAVSGSSAARGDTLQHSLENATAAVNALATASTTNTAALQQTNSSLSSLRSIIGQLAGGLAGGGGNGILGSLLGGGIGGLVSVGQAIAGLFGGGTTPRAPVPYIAPPSIAIEAASAPGLPTTSYDQAGLPRINTPQPQASQSVTLHINALDSQSILDRAPDIAAAVRDAMLGMHPLNDFINEL
jgi:hypothetical protein